MSEERYINASGHRLYYEYISRDLLETDKPVLIFLHEGLGCIPSWKKFPQLLCEKLDLPALLYDRYGYGKSEMVKEPRNVDFLQKEALDVLPELLEKLNLHKKKIILIGHSDGGSIAIMYASKFGENVAGLVVMAPHVLIEDWSLKGIHSAIDAYKNKDLRERLIKYHGENTDSMFNSWVNIWTTEEGHHWNIEDFLPGITAPLLFIQGENDNYGTVVQQNSVINGVSGYAEGLMIPDIGHFPHLESKNLVLDKIHEFIQKQF